MVLSLISPSGPVQDRTLQHYTYVANLAGFFFFDGTGHFPTHFNFISKVLVQQMTISLFNIYAQ